MIALSFLFLLSGVQVELSPAAEASGAELSLEEIATVSGEDAGLIARVRALELGYAPAPGYSRSLQAWQVERELKQSFPAVEFELVGAPTCRIEPAVLSLDSARLHGPTRLALMEAYPGEDVEIVELERLKPLVVPKGRVGIEIKPRVDRSSKRLGRLSVPVEVYVDKNLYRTVWTNWEVRAWTEVPVLLKDVRAGETLSPRLFRRERIRLDGSKKEAWVSEAALDGAVSRRHLTAGSAVFGSDVERKWLVRRGDAVQLQVTRGAISATSSAIAQEDGFFGDSIRVLAGSSQRELRARVAGRELVTVDLVVRK